MLRTGLAIFTAAMCAAVAPAAAEWKPSRPIEFIASGAGGGTDNFARTVQAALGRNGVIEQDIVVLNKGGGSGAEGFLYAKQNKGNPHKVIFGTNNVYLLPHVAKLPYTADDLIPIYAMAVDDFLVWVKADSPYQTVTDLIEAAKNKPNEVIFGGSQSKDTDETVVSLIEQTTGAKFKYLPFNGGGEVAVQLAGGHVAANVNNPNENIGQWQGGNVRPLCVLAPQRMNKSEPIYDGKGWHDVPTCKEQGLNIESYQMPRTVWLPAGTPDEAIDYYRNALRKVSETQEWKDYLRKTSQSGKALTGEELGSFIKADEESNLKVYKAEGWLAN